MKYVYIILVVALLGFGGYLLVNQSSKVDEVATVIPEGSHVMPDGSIMEGEVMEETDDDNLAPVSDPNQASVTLDPNARVFQVRGINYGYDVKEIVVKKGETVTIEFESTDGFHDWVVDEFEARTDRVQPGTRTSVTFVADEIGAFEYYCSVGSHRAHGMVGKLIVEES